VGEEKVKLYEIANNYQQALANLDPEDEAYSDTLEAIEGEIEEKGKNVAAYFLNLDSDISQLKEAEDKIKARRLAIQKQSDKLKDYLRFNMQETGISKIECPEFKITLGKPSQIVAVDDDLDVRYVVEKVTKSPDKAAIKADLKDGIIIKGAKLVEGKARLIIK